ncbi:hypothetical protein PPYR_14037 [Photinus pyralis]|uniref:BTB domain-containing protein n=1 Tax=Photinus pyralis TaxID=7054 RepID=A0A1Y1M5W1_PHOPY|nr:uncharacterized protein LOC116181504 [Photinus pyralis]KAB0792076.1 hypothetical protein PPYR_14037 [Photinus pyralis]
MEEFERATDNLRLSADHRELFKTLMTIRNHLEGPLPAVKESIKKIQEKDSLKVLISCLQQKRQPIINVSLSILGRCCMERNFVRISVNRYNLVHHLNSLIKRHEVNSIRVRVFRIIGNMCQHWDRFANTIIEKEPSLHLVERIVNYLKTSSSPNLEAESDNSEDAAAIMSAIRALRELANKETIARLIDLGVLNAVGVVLVRWTPLWIERKRQVDLLLAAVRLIYSYSKYNVPKSISELQAAEGGDAMLCLGKMVELCPTVILRIIINLKHITTSRSDLPMGTISECLIDKLKNPSGFSDGYEDKAYRECLKCLCYFIQSLLIQESALVNTVIVALLAILDSFESMSDIMLKNSTLIVASLNVYVTSDNFALLMLQNAVTGILVKKLDLILGANASYHEVHECHSKTSGHNATTDSPRKMGCRSTKSVVELTFDRASSPYCESLISSGSQSPWSSPNISELEATESDSDDYSPVCSDAECEVQPVDDLDTPHSPHNDERDERSSLAGSTLADTSTTLLKKEMVAKILNLVQYFQALRPAPMELISPPDFLLRLLMLCAPSNHAFRAVDPVSLVKMIARRPEYLISLMQSSFFPTVYKMTMSTHDSCCTCDELYKLGRDILKTVTVTVEHKCGKGDIAHQLYRGNDEVKRQIVPIIPLIVNNNKVLNQLMRIGGGLEVLLGLVREDSDLQASSILGLSCLSKKLGIVNPKSVKESSKFAVPLQLELDNYALRESCSVVFFTLDDGSVVHADRELLCERSVYFNQMLSGTFREAREHEICLHKVSNNGLKFLFLLMRLDLDTKDVYMFDVNLKTLLDVIILTDRYLLEDYCACLTNSVQTFKFQPDSMATIYDWSLESHTDILRIEAVAYALVGNMAEHDRYTMFRSLLDLNRTEDLMKDIYGLLSRQFKMI